MVMIVGQNSDDLGLMPETETLAKFDGLETSFAMFYLWQLQFGKGQPLSNKQAHFWYNIQKIPNMRMVFARCN